MKIAFVVGSFIQPYTGGSQSAYSTSERVSQTQATISSIRERCPEATIYFVEGSEIDITRYKFDYDVLVRPTSDFEAKKLIYSSQKSIGESVMMVYTGNTEALEEYDLVFKISGRYLLTEDFDVSNFSTDKFSFYDHVQWGYETTLYSFPGHLKHIWIEVHQKAITFMSNNSMDSIEKALRAWLNVKYVVGVTKLGVQGFNAPHRRFIKY